MVADYETSDLHCIMALANENNRSREVRYPYYTHITTRLNFKIKTIWAGDKVTSALSNEEMYKFLPVMMEMIVWKSSDEDVDELVKNIVKKDDK